MIDTRIRLSVLHDAGGVFAEYTEEAADFGRDTFALALGSVEDYLYLGYAKPFGAAYCELATANVNANTLAMQYWDGSGWTAVEGRRDLTKGLTRSGAFRWEKSTDWTATDVDGVTLFWVRMRPSVTHSATTIAGISLALADDYDLETEFAAVRESGFIPAGEVSHIKTHTAVRNQIIQDLRNQGYIKQDAEGNWGNITPWDLHDVEEVRQAAVYLALAKIFFNYSDDPADHWNAKSKVYEEKYKDNLKLLRVSLDTDDDGEEDEAEKAVFRVIRMTR